jgi:hypothetical protein
MSKSEFPVAHLNEDVLEKIQKFEKDLRKATKDEELILIAYQKK